MIVNNIEHVGNRLHLCRGNEFEYNTIITIDGEAWLYDRDAISPDTDNNTASVEAINAVGDQATLVWHSRHDIKYDGWDYYFDWERDLEEQTIYEYGYKKPMILILFDKDCSVSAFITPNGYLVSMEDMESIAYRLDFDIDEMSTNISAHLYGGTAVIWREGNLTNEEEFMFEAK